MDKLMEENKLEKLNEYIIEQLEMELDNNTVSSISDEIINWEAQTEFKLDDNDRKTIEELKKYKDYNYLYATDAQYGGTWGQGYIIVDQDLNYIDFVRTI